MERNEEPGKWVKIGETVKSAPAFTFGLYAKYAVMEMICHDGMRKYKEVRMCTWTESSSVASPNG